MDLRGVRSLKTKWVQNTSPEVMNSVFPKANFFLGHPVGWHGVSFNTFSTLGISFVGNNCVKQGRIFEPFLYIKNEFWENNWVKQGFGILFGLDLIGF